MAEKSAGNGRIPQLEIFRRVWRFFKAQIVQDIPDEDAACEFDCRVDQCNMGEWATCEHRLRTTLQMMRAAEAPDRTPPDPISTRYTESPTTLHHHDAEARGK